MIDEVCRFSGCVGLAEVGGLCPVHRQKLGVKCDYCKGHGYLLVGGLQLPLARGACDRCGGTGLRDTRARVTRVKGSDPVDGRGLIVASDGVERLPEEVSPETLLTLRASEK